MIERQAERAKPVGKSPEQFGELRRRSFLHRCLPTTAKLIVSPKPGKSSLASVLYLLAWLIKAGKLRPIAMATMKRFPVFPDLPTMREQGFEGADFSTWWALYAPAGTPQPIIAQLGLWLREACEDDALQKTLETIGNIVLIDDGAATLDR